MDVAITNTIPFLNDRYNTLSHGQQPQQGLEITLYIK